MTVNVSDLWLIGANFPKTTLNHKKITDFFEKILNFLPKKVYNYYYSTKNMGVCMNMPLLSAIFTIAFTVSIGILLIIAFVAGFDKASHIIGCIVIGAVISLPLAILVTKKINRLTGKPAHAPKR